jgi:hypothetical protein
LQGAGQLELQLITYAYISLLLDAKARSVINNVQVNSSATNYFKKFHQNHQILQIN